MGLDLDKEPLGDDCAGCFAGSGTPKYVYARLSGPGNCDKFGCGPPPAIRGGAIIRLTQHDADPCLWLRQDANFSYRYVAHPFSSFRIVAGLGPLMFNKSKLTCHRWFANGVSCDDFGVCGAGGLVRVYFKKPAQAVAGLLNIPTGIDTYFEGFLVDEDIGVDRFANRKLGINIKIKHTNELP